MVVHRIGRVGHISHGRFKAILGEGIQDLRGQIYLGSDRLSGGGRALGVKWGNAGVERGMLDRKEPMTPLARPGLQLRIDQTIRSADRANERLSIIEANVAYRGLARRRDGTSDMASGRNSPDRTRLKAAQRTASTS